jgi:hypothetical protein
VCQEKARRRSAAKSANPPPVLVVLLVVVVLISRKPASGGQLLGCLKMMVRIPAFMRKIGMHNTTSATSTTNATSVFNVTNTKTVSTRLAQENVSTIFSQDYIFHARPAQGPRKAWQAPHKIHDRAKLDDTVR